MSFSWSPGVHLSPRRGGVIQYLWCCGYIHSQLDWRRIPNSGFTNCLSDTSDTTWKMKQYSWLKKKTFLGEVCCDAHIFVCICLCVWSSVFCVGGVRACVFVNKICRVINTNLLFSSDPRIGLFNFDSLYSVDPLYVIDDVNWNKITKTAIFSQFSLFYCWLLEYQNNKDSHVYNL